ncbi:conserved hypothetical protein [Theileria equi strain WA]|uniref:Uncharacterized protein n=1 Tax=Theileria equi strain WA TaxID=1537102 RepID=L1L9Y3_THEEQ|nr:conserved hypothetical protein [Theileria equi strain WA]EKX72000.1 conserved hypothetical protein [Theileria equi strain WA]|eukprot:XP_004831452.1 conserved hypothetical protein [Theileria equi strain WA]
MLKTPPGITHRKNVSKALNEASAVFEALYKKHFSSDIDSLQREAEDYLIKSLYKSAAARSKETSLDVKPEEPKPLEKGASKVHIDYGNDRTLLDHKPAKSSSSDKRVSIDTRVLVEETVVDKEESDATENEEDQPVCLKIEAIPFAEGHLEGADISPTHYASKNTSSFPRLSRRSTLRIPSALKTISFYCLAIQFLSSLLLGGLFYLLVHYKFKRYTKVITIAYPFVIHLVLYIIIFSLSDKKLKGTFLLYSNDISIAVLRRKLVKEETYNHLNKVHVIIERCFVFLCLVISCLPCDFATEDKSYSFFEYSYLIAIGNLFGLYLMVTYFYFYIIFNKTIKKSMLSV